jgi:hypothetical protein
MATKKASAKRRKGAKAPTRKPSKKHPGPVPVPDIRKHPKKKKTGSKKR